MNYIPVEFQLPSPKYVSIKPGELSAARIRKICHEPRRRTFYVHGTTGKTHMYVSRTWGKRWKIIKNHAHIYSVAVVSDNLLTIHSEVEAGHVDKSFKAPFGYAWGVDSLGVKLYRKNSPDDDYHVSVDILLKTTLRELCRRLRGNALNRRAADARIKAKDRACARRRKEQERLDKLMQRDLPSTRVTLWDSQRAGNCVEGSLVFAERKLGISRQEIIAGGYLFSVSAQKLIKTGEERAKAAVRVAWRRETTISI